VALVTDAGAAAAAAPAAVCFWSNAEAANRSVGYSANTFTVSASINLFTIAAAALSRRAPRAEEAKKELSAEYIANQKEVDAALLKALSPELKGYLSTRFSLKDGDRPHLMKF
jgi:hypothetical protein